MESWQGVLRTSTVAVEVLLSSPFGFGGSVVVLETVDVLEITVPFGTLSIWYVARKVAVAPRSKLVIVQEVEPVSPTFGLVQVNTGPSSCTND